MPKLSPAGFWVREFLHKQGAGYQFTIPYLAAQSGFSVPTISCTIQGLKVLKKLKIVEKPHASTYGYGGKGSLPAKWQTLDSFYSNVPSEDVQAALEVQSVLASWVVGKTSPAKLVISEELSEEWETFNTRERE